MYMNEHINDVFENQYIHWHEKKKENPSYSLSSTTNDSTFLLYLIP